MEILLCITVALVTAISFHAWHVHKREKDFCDRLQSMDVSKMGYKEIKGLGVNNLRKCMGLGPLPEELINKEFIWEDELKGRAPRPNEVVGRTANVNLPNKNIAIGFWPKK